MNSATKREKDTMSETRVITITTDGDGNFTYDPSTLKVRHGDQVQWTTGTLGPFAISFNDSTPFYDDVTVSSEVDSDGNNITPEKEIAKGKVGHHHYSVAIAMIPATPDKLVSADLVTVALDSGCPDIVVSS